RCEVLVEGQVLQCELSPKLAASQHKDVAVGDDAFTELRGDVWTLTGIGPRRSKLSRVDVGHANRERVIVANVDVVVI
ncbi:hypothetical protein AAEH85_22490, partial [Shewanella algae]|uniref:hypothetical protein n=1 Tax=Shewanella algae TaxID=38313 RepID=UPI00313DD231